MPKIKEKSFVCHIEISTINFVTFDLPGQLNIFILEKIVCWEKKVWAFFDYKLYTMFFELKNVLKSQKSALFGVYSGFFSAWLFCVAVIYFWNHRLPPRLYDWFYPMRKMLIFKLQNWYETVHTLCNFLYFSSTTQPIYELSDKCTP